MQRAAPRAPGGAMVRSPPAMQEIQVQPLGGEEPLEKEMATHFSVLARETPVDIAAWKAAIHGVAKSQPQLSN